MRRRVKKRVVVVVWSGSESLKKAKVGRKEKANRDAVLEVSSELLILM